MRPNKPRTTRTEWLPDWVKDEHSSSQEAVAAFIGSGIILILIGIATDYLEWGVLAWYWHLTSVATAVMAYRMPSDSHWINNFMGSVLVGIVCGWWLWVPLAVWNWRRS